MFKTLIDAGLTLKLSKCVFAKREINFLGFTIGQRKIRPNGDKVCALERLSEPVTKKGVRSILAMFRYYHAHIPHFSEIALPLTELTKKKFSNAVELNEEQRSALQSLKDTLVKAKVLYVPRYDRKFVIMCDSSQFTVAGVLSQFDDNGLEHPSLFASKKLTPTQVNWSAVEKEAFAVIFSLSTFDVYIFGSEIEIFTDHNPLTYLASSSTSSAKLMRWYLTIQRYNIKIIHKAGKLNVVADCFSRV